MVTPLKKIKRDGTRYTRPAEIEASIAEALRQDLDRLIQRAAQRDRKQSDYLPSECLVHLVRGAQRRGEGKMRDVLLPLLLERCLWNLHATVPDGQIATAHHLREDILGDFAELFAIDGSPRDTDELDFYETRFNAAFRSFRIDHARAEMNRLNRETALPDATDEGLDERTVSQDVLAGLEDLHRTTVDPEERVYRQQLHRAVLALPTKERQAFVLCHLMGFKEESENPNERTAATICGVTGRSIRNWLKSARTKLSTLKEDV